MTDESSTTPPLVELLCNGLWPDEAEAQTLVDDLYHQRAIHAYMTILPDVPTSCGRGAAYLLGIRDKNNHSLRL